MYSSPLTRLGSLSLTWLSVRHRALDVVQLLHVSAMCLELGGETPSEKTVRDFEKFFRERHGSTQVPRYLLLHEHIVRACLSAAWRLPSTSPFQ